MRIIVDVYKELKEKIVDLYFQSTDAIGEVDI